MLNVTTASFKKGTLRTTAGHRWQYDKGQVLQIGVPLYDTSRENAQKVVDNPNSAVFLRWRTQNVIADHASQANFRNMSGAIPGKTMAFIETEAGQKRFICYQTQVGHILIREEGNKIYDSKWDPVFEQNAGGLTIYTCLQRSADDIMDVRLTYWKEIQ